jgi:hypothetical protein
MEYFSTPKGLTYDELVQERIDLADMVQVAEDLEQTGETFNWAFYCSMAFSLRLALLCLCFVLGDISELSRVTRCLQNFIMLPIFVLFVVLSWVFSMVFVIGSNSTSIPATPAGRSTVSVQPESSGAFHAC